MSNPEPLVPDSASPTPYSVAEARRAEAVGREVLVHGWVRTRRDSKAGLSFLEINDGSCFGNVQVIAETGLPNYESEIKHLSPGCSITVAGLVKPSPGKGQATEIHAAAKYGLRHGRRGDAIPCRRKGTRSSSCGRSPTCGRGPIRSGPSPGCETASATRSTSFSRSAASSTSTRPIITASDCEGAGAMFQVTTLDLTRSREGRTPVDFALDFFDRPAYLTVSGQLEAETFACALGKTYTFGPTFRAENSNTPRHLAEFWMVEPEVAFCDLWGDMELAEGLLKRIFGDVLEKCPEDMQFFNERIDKTILETVAAHPRQPVPPRFLHRGGRDPGQIGPGVRVSHRLGQRPPGRARALPHRKAFPAAGDPLRLSARRSSRSTCA